jgi:PIN domain nuclease of toxin-antitoxin system
LRRLLDTHIALWALTLDARLPAATADLIRDPQIDIYVSAASLWEVAIKSALPPRRSQAAPLSATTLAGWLRETDISILPVTETHALAVERLPRLHGDPFDRLLVAQAISEPMTLITHDSQLAAYSDLVTVV